MTVKLKLTEVSTKNCEDVWNVKMSCFHYLFEHTGTCTVFSNGAALINNKKKKNTLYVLLNIMQPVFTF